MTMKLFAVVAVIVATEFKDVVSGPMEMFDAHGPEQGRQLSSYHLFSHSMT